ncbi:hypothetical protein [Aurantimonas sp. VKM B-3413]|uniref:hypothetical protein n=1 Tax=Aurantimonas sp. VKM B-3413 TaxID=2779401 RepID=UPI001E5292A8|nr:hypothetical protein [Aurantimonas sp. VKM B-3413]MCB8837758.1 hypothetical protein [Aurantimonas sp. VKM B-3413]
MLAKTAALAMFGVALSTTGVLAATVNIVVMQEDWDPESLPRNNRIQNAVLSEFNQTLNAPAYQSVLKRYGIEGMDVYDETSVSLNFYQQDRQRRTDEELISLARTVKNPTLDVVVPYTLYARAVTDPYTQIVKLQMSLNYRALDVRSGRFFGGDNLDIDTAGVPFTGCATAINGTQADPHCVKEFVSQNGEKLARNAGNKLAIQLAALLGRKYSSSDSYDDSSSENTAANEAIETDVAHADRGTIVHERRSSACGNLPTTYAVKFRGFEQRQVNAVEEYMAFWKCAINLNVSDSDFSEVTFQYKTRADQQRVLRNIRLMLELMGVVAEPQTIGSNEIVVEVLGLREN